MPAPRTVFIINPQSQNGALGRQWPHLGGKIRRELDSFEELRTEGPGHATELARAAIADGAERVVAIGGDGTINEVVNGFFDAGQLRSPDVAFGVIPFGTGGDFRKTLRVPDDPVAAARILAAGHTRRLDVGKLEFTGHDGADQLRMFINIASFGLSGLVDDYVNKSSKRLGGKLSFMLATARAALRYQNQRVHLEFDGDPGDSADVSINTVAVANGRYFGGGMFIAPDAELDDGYFDVVVVGDFGRLEMAVSSGRLYKGTHLSHDKISHRRARVVRAEAVGADEVLLDVDGEAPGRLPATFTVLPEILTVAAVP